MGPMVPLLICSILLSSLSFAQTVTSRPPGGNEIGFNPDLGLLISMNDLAYAVNKAELSCRKSKKKMRDENVVEIYIRFQLEETSIKEQCDKDARKEFYACLANDKEVSKSLKKVFLIPGIFEKLLPEPMTKEQAATIADFYKGLLNEGRPGKKVDD